jgi:hypothetical protein
MTEQPSNAKKEKKSLMTEKSLRIYLTIIIGKNSDLSSKTLTN